MKHFLAAAAFIFAFPALSDTGLNAPVLKEPKHAPLVQKLGHLFFGEDGKATSKIEVSGETPEGKACKMWVRKSRWGFWAGTYREVNGYQYRFESGITNSHYTTSELKFKKAQGKFIVDRKSVTNINERGADLNREHLEISVARGANGILSLKGVKVTIQYLGDASEDEPQSNEAPETHECQVKN